MFYIKVNTFNLGVLILNIYLLTIYLFKAPAYIFILNLICLQLISYYYSRNKRKSQGFHSERDLLQTQELTKTGSWIVNLQTQTCYWSKVTYDIHAEPYDKPISLKDGINYYIDAHKPVIEKCVKDAIEHGKPWDQKLQIRDAKGNIKWVRAVGEASKNEKGQTILRGIFRDIHEEELTLQNLRDLNIGLNLTLYSAKVGLWSWDLRNNELVWSKEMFKLYEKPYNAGIAFEGWESSVVKADLDATVKALQTCITTGKSLNTSFRIKTKRGIKYIKVRGECLLDEENKPYKMVGINLDVTAEELYTQNLIKINEELNNFTAVITHDLRQPVTVFLGYLDILNSSEFHYDKDQQDCLREMLNSAKQMESITNDLIDILHAGKSFVGTEKCDPNKILSKILLHLNYNTELITINTPSFMPKLAVSARDCRALFNNILSNAIKFSKKDVPNSIRIESVEYKDCVKITIKDTGIGIKPKDLVNLPKPFYRVYPESEYPGTGIGLALCDKMVKKYGYALEIESVYGEGTSVSFELPI